MEIATTSKKSCWQVGRYGSSPNSADNALRDQLHQEIENKSKSCSHPTYNCNLPRVDGYEYCLNHILTDGRSNYRQCTYVYNNFKKCVTAVYRPNSTQDQNLSTLCFKHSRQAQLDKTRATIGKLKHVETNEVILNNLSHHIRIKEKPIQINQDTDEEIDVVSSDVEPFIAHVEVNSVETVIEKANKKPRVLDYASDSSDDNDNIINISNTWGGQDEDDSEHNCYGSDDDDDPLRHANVYTDKEVLRISIEKMTKLREMYISQISRLQHLLKNCRRRYINDIRKEREIHCSIKDQVKSTPEERRTYNNLKHLGNYRRRHGIDAVLYKRLKEKRMRLSETYLPKPNSFPKCIFTEGGVKCGQRTIPCTKYCQKHILEDKKQVLFRPCNTQRANVICKEPVPCIGENNFCLLHMNIPLKQQYTQKKCETETDDDLQKDNLKITPKLEKRETKGNSRRSIAKQRRRRQENRNKLNISTSVAETLIKQSEQVDTKIESPLQEEMKSLTSRVEVKSEEKLEYVKKEEENLKKEIANENISKLEVEKEKTLLLDAPQLKEEVAVAEEKEKEKTQQTVENLTPKVQTPSNISGSESGNNNITSTRSSRRLNQNALRAVMKNSNIKKRRSSPLIQSDKKTDE